MTMALGRHGKTEHAGAKHGCGAYWGRKIDAKNISKKLRRLKDKLIARRKDDE